MVDYSKWKDIEISDDEDDTHPNIDTPSLFRWRHQARVERMEERKREKEEHERKKNDTLKKLKDTKQKLVQLETEKSKTDDLSEIKKALHELEKEEKVIKEHEEELQKKEKLTPWNVDTIGQEGFAKTVINKKPPRKDEESMLSDDEKEKRMRQFVKENEKKLKAFGMLRKYEDSKKYLQDNLHLVCENTANYLAMWCINLEMEEIVHLRQSLSKVNTGKNNLSSTIHLNNLSVDKFFKKHDLMEHVAHQCICMQYILEFSKQLDVDPRACVGSFFSRIQIAEVEYKTSFDDELRAFKERIRKRAAEKIAAAIKEAEEEEEEERKARLGPGGLDPAEVFESLPVPLQKCFESQDIPLLQQTIASMPEEEARYHMKRCIDSGLWVPDAKAKEESSINEEENEVPSDN